jgi:hypothetical protein
MTVYHKELASGRWFTMLLVEQLANIGSEVHRTIVSFRKKDGRFQSAFERALELFDLTLADLRWKGRYKEIARSRELFCTLLIDSGKFENLENEFDFIDKYFMQFGIYAAILKSKK